MINLILGVFKNYEGSLKINNLEISDFPEENFYEKIGFVSQNITLLQRSIKDNIKYGCNNATDEDVFGAARVAYCDEFIQNLPQGYDTLIGVNGVKLSGGQRQRIALARMIVKDAPFIIMDEPTSALDKYTEKKICENLNNFVKDKTLLIVSHNSAFLQLVDNVYQLINGKLEVKESLKS